MPSEQRPDAPACARNREPILQQLRSHFADVRRVLEIGSGTGQHAVYFARHLPHLRWQTSDLPENHDGIQQWLAHSALDNVDPPIPLDVSQTPWPVSPCDALFSANTLHIMPTQAVEQLFEHAPAVLSAGAPVVIYGPFKQHGRYSGPSDRQFDQWLKDEAPHQGIRDLEWVDSLAQRQGFELLHNTPMPANNRLLCWRRSQD